jgi:hypothetical protein
MQLKPSNGKSYKALQSKKTLKFWVTQILEFSSGKSFQSFKKDVAYLPRPSNNISAVLKLKLLRLLQQYDNVTNVENSAT